MDTADSRRDQPSAVGGLRQLVESTWFVRSVILLIVASALLLGLETLQDIPAPVLAGLQSANRLILLVFVFEIALRIAAYRGAFFRSGWNLFDLAIVAASLIPPPGPLQMLRALRVLRVLRLVSTVPSLRRVVDGLLDALPGLGSIIVLLLLLLYVAAVMATHLYRDVAPDDFGSLGVSLMTLFQVMTLEAWPDVAKPIMAVDPWAWLFFVSYILVATFMVLNLFIGVVVSAIQTRIASEAEADASRDQALASDVAGLRDEIRQLRAELLRRGEER